MRRRILSRRSWIEVVHFGGGIEILGLTVGGKYQTIGGVSVVFV